MDARLGGSRQQDHLPLSGYPGTAPSAFQPAFDGRPPCPGRGNVVPWQPAAYAAALVGQASRSRLADGLPLQCHAPAVPDLFSAPFSRSPLGLSSPIRKKSVVSHRRPFYQQPVGPRIFPLLPAHPTGGQSLKYGTKSPHALAGDPEYGAESAGSSGLRSEERRVGKECRSWWWTYA